MGVVIAPHSAFKTNLFHCIGIPMNIRTILQNHLGNFAAVWREHPFETFWTLVFGILLLVLPQKFIESEDLFLYWLPLLPYLTLMYKMRHRRAPTSPPDCCH